MLAPNVAAVGEFGALVSAHNEPPFIPQFWYLVANKGHEDLPRFECHPVRFSAACAASVMRAAAGTVG